MIFNEFCQCLMYFRHICIGKILFPLNCGSLDFYSLYMCVYLFYGFMAVARQWRTQDFSFGGLLCGLVTVDGPNRSVMYLYIYIIYFNIMINKFVTKSLSAESQNVYVSSTADKAEAHFVILTTIRFAYYKHNNNIIL